ncbi:aminopeptidase P family protein [Balneolales bacterium ANBcel1]|nr:aminopeptidase P family protein [Balneolales bacterium ANBcel1]
MYQNHRQKLLNLFREQSGHLIYLKGGSVAGRYHTDFEYPFRQESNFLYLTGIDEPDMAAFFECGSGEYTLVIPRRSSQFAVWMGYILTPEEYRERYGPDHIIYNDEVHDWLKKRAPQQIHILPDSGDEIAKAGYQTESGELQDALAYCRVIKTDGEMDCLKKAASAANQAHLEVMKAVGPGVREYEMKALFDYHTHRHGMVHAPYSGIFASGPGSAILHYTGYRRTVEANELFLVDAGAEYAGYAADVTRTMPAGASFTPLQADLYDIVLDAQNTALNLIRPGNKMEDLHLAAARCIASGLRDCGLLRGSVDDLMETNIFALFFPHGLGHFLGLDTHDVGGYPKGTEKIDRPGLRFLRARRTFESGMVLTIEPGLYFIPALLEPAFEDGKTSSFLNREKLAGLLDFGGIRIEDNVIVRDDGMENLTTAPKTRHEIEHVKQGD